MKRHSKKIGFLCLGLLMGLCFIGAAQQTIRIAVVDSQKAFFQSSEGQKAVAQLKAKEQSINTELSKIDNQILSFENKLQVQNLTLTFEAKQDLTQKINDLKVQRQRVQEDSTQEYIRLRDRLFQKAQAEMLTIIRSMAREQEFSLVMEAGAGVLYYDQAFDITAEVIKRYDASKGKTK